MRAGSVQETTGQTQHHNIVSLMVGHTGIHWQYRDLMSAANGASCYTVAFDIWLAYGRLVSAAAAGSTALLVVALWHSLAADPWSWCMSCKPYG
jgi:hypothetical protein